MTVAKDIIPQLNKASTLGNSDRGYQGAYRDKPALEAGPALSISESRELGNKCRLPAIAGDCACAGHSKSSPENNIVPAGCLASSVPSSAYAKTRVSSSPPSVVSRHYNKSLDICQVSRLNDELGLKSSPFKERGDSLIPPLAVPEADALSGGRQGAKPPGYLECNANVSSWLGKTCDRAGFQWFIPGECQNGHRFAKELVCGKEWCSRCGEDGSVAHNRRFARWLPKVQQLGTMGYFVFTIPEALRANYRTKKALAALGHKIQELLKSYGYPRGLRRWHFFGDKSTKWHPHLNCLVDGGFVSPAKLDALKSAYARLLGADVVDVNYRYRLTPGKMVHTLKYVTRATFRDYDWDLEMALELWGFRNMVVWGRGQWDGEAVWSLSDLGGEAKAEVEGLDIEAINSLVSGVCPVCGLALTWGEALPIGLLDMVDKQSLGAGYWRLADIPPPPELPDDVKQRLYWLELLHRAEVQVAVARAEAEARAKAAEYQGWWAGLISNN
ncbi:hypothetical protein ES705_30188 [subsurface metagenome]